MLDLKPELDRLNRIYIEVLGELPTDEERLRRLRDAINQIELRIKINLA